MTGDTEDTVKLQEDIDRLGGNGSFRSYSRSDPGSFRSYSLSVRSIRPGSFRPDLRGGSFRPTFCLYSFQVIKSCYCYPDCFYAVIISEKSCSGFFY